MSTEYTLAKDVPVEQLPFSARKQDALLGHCIIKDKVFRLCGERIRSGWFMDPMNQTIWASMQAFFEKFKRVPKEQEVMDAPSVKAEDVAVRNRLRQKVQECLQVTQQIGLDVVQADLTEWLQARTYQKAVEDSYRLYKAQRPREAYEAFQEGARAIRDVSFVEDEAWDFSAYGAHFEADSAELRDAVTTGSETLDKVLNPDAIEGALLKGDVTYILAPVNVGKSRTLITIARHNVVKRRKAVLYIPHEGRHRNLEELFFASILSRPPTNMITPRMVHELYRTVEGRRVLEAAVEIMRRHLCFLPMNKAGLTVEAVGTAIRRRNDQWAADHGGHGFDLVVDDYPGKLTTQLAQHGHFQKRHADDVVSDYFVQLALELDVHVVAAFQTNREGSKVHHGRSREHGKRLLYMEDSNESFGPMQNVANVLTLNRDAEAQKRKVMIINVAKSRTGLTGRAVIVGGDFAACVTHDDAFGATSYAGGGVPSEVTDDLIDQFQAQAKEKVAPT